MLERLDEHLLKESSEELSLDLDGHRGLAHMMTFARESHWFRKLVPDLVAFTMGGLMTS